MLIPVTILNNSSAIARLWSRERENNRPQLIASLLQRYKTFSAVISGILTRMPTNQDAPLKTYLDHLKRGELAYQFSPEAGRAVFYPRMLCPSLAVIGWNGASAKGPERYTPRRSCIPSRPSRSMLR